MIQVEVVKFKGAKTRVGVVASWNTYPLGNNFILVTFPTLNPTNLHPSGCYCHWSEVTFSGTT